MYGGIGSKVVGHRGSKARYVPEVHADENTVRFWQEIYDSSLTEA